jgi:hypothetical protein
MSDRTDFNNKAEEILDFVDTYEMVRYEHLDKLFPSIKKAVNYLIKNQRLHKSTDGIYIGITADVRPDKCLTAALSVLADVIDKVQTYARAAAPAQISFLTHSGDYYEIIYVGYGAEVMTAAFFETGLAAKQRPKDYVDTTRRIVIVEDKNQMERLNILGAVRFALVAPDGSLSYFKGS